MFRAAIYAAESEPGKSILSRGPRRASGSNGRDKKILALGD
jgi:hypothetical protein